MISASEALRLPSAQLSNEERIGADILETALEEAIRKNYEYRGMEIETKELRQNVIAEVNQRLRKAGYLAQWQPIVRQHPLNKSVQEHIGWKLALNPSDDAYREAAQLALS